MIWLMPPFRFWHRLIEHVALHGIARNDGGVCADQARDDGAFGQSIHRRLLLYVECKAIHVVRYLFDTCDARDKSIGHAKRFYVPRSMHDAPRQLEGV